MKLIAEGVVKPDKLIEKSGIGYNELTEILTGLELAGHIERGQDGAFSIV